MTSMASSTAGVVIGGVDTHGQTHHAAAMDRVGRQLGDGEFPASPTGYRALAEWLGEYGTVEAVGVEGAGSYGAGLARHLRTIGVTVVEVDRTDRKSPRAHGKSGPLDAYAAARAGTVDPDTTITLMAPSLTSSTPATHPPSTTPHPPSNTPCGSTTPAAGATSTVCPALGLPRNREGPPHCPGNGDMNIVFAANHGPLIEQGTLVSAASCTTRVKFSSAAAKVRVLPMVHVRGAVVAAGRPGRPAIGQRQTWGTRAILPVSPGRTSSRAGLRISAPPPGAGSSGSRRARLPRG